MSVTFGSPKRCVSDNNSLYTPSDNESCVSSEGNTPFITSTKQQTSNSTLHQEFLNTLQARQLNQYKQNASTESSQQTLPQYNYHLQLEDLAPIESQLLHSLMTKYNDQQILVVDVRSFSCYSRNRIRSAIHICVPSVLLKRPSYTLEKVCETIIFQEAANRLRHFQHATHIIFYDHASYKPSDSGNSATALLLGSKLRKVGYKGQLNYLQGGFDTFSDLYPDQCELVSLESTNKPKRQSKELITTTPTKKALPPTSIALPTSLNSTPAICPFFSNIRQNLELSQGPLQERLHVRLPFGFENKNGIISPTTSSPGSAFFSNNNNAHHPRCGLAGSSVDAQGNFELPMWLKDIMDEKTGPKKLAEMYEELERTEQKRLSTIMKYHSQCPGNSTNTSAMDKAGPNQGFPFSITSSMEKGALNRYDNIWPYEYSRVKLKDNKDDYINANYVQYANIKKDITLSPVAQSEQEVELEEKGLLSEASIRTMNQLNAKIAGNRRYISTQGPLSTTFDDFWQMIWAENSHVIVMLTKEIEMNKIKCHRYWPSLVNVPQTYGALTIVLVSECKQAVINMNDKRERDNADECIIIRKLCLKRDGQERTVTHLQYTGWTDFGVPDHPAGILQLVHQADKANSHYAEENQALGPMVVHCSAGCGRSGTFCVIDTMIQRLWHERDVYTCTSNDKVWGTICRFREQRMSMVQTHRQFVFCYEAILWWLLGYGHLPFTSLSDSVITNEQCLHDNLVPSLPTLFPTTASVSKLVEDDGQNSLVGSIVDDFKSLM